MDKIDTAALETIAKMSGSTIEIKEVVDKWLLLTYDIPHSKEGDKLRRQVISKAREIGATMHTESVLLLPWTPEAELLALQVAKGGKAVVWTSVVTDKTQAEEITSQYDAGIRKGFKEISERLDKAEYYMTHHKYKMADKMQEKTGKIIESMKQAIIRRGSAAMFITVSILYNRFNKLYGR